MSFIVPHVLTYEDHSDEIASLNRLLASMQQRIPDPAMKPHIDWILARIDWLMADSEPKLKVYDQREHHV